MSKKILVVLSEWGYWGEELIGPLDVLTSAGYSLDFMTPNGRKPVALPPSMDETYIDPPLDKGVTSAHFAKRTKEVDSSDLLTNPINLSEKLPLMPYFNSEKFGHKLEEFFNTREEFWKESLYGAKNKDMANRGKWNQENNYERDKGNNVLECTS